MIATQTLNGDNAAGAQQRNTLCEQRITRIAVVRPDNLLVELECASRNPTELRTTREAGIGLRMKASVERILVLSSAGRTHLKISHGCVGAVVGQAIQDGKARTAISAVDKRIPVTSVLRVKKLRRTRLTRAQIGRYQRGVVSFLIFGELNGELLKALRVNFAHRNLSDVCCRGLFAT